MTQPFQVLWLSGTHEVEVVHLGPVAMTVCHDCSYEFGFDDTHSCERIAQEHRAATA